jgi:hypothetical protein
MGADHTSREDDFKEIAVPSFRYETQSSAI